MPFKICSHDSNPVIQFNRHFWFQSFWKIKLDPRHLEQANQIREVPWWRCHHVAVRKMGASSYQLRGVTQIRFNQHGSPPHKSTIYKWATWRNNIVIAVINMETNKHDVVTLYTSLSHRIQASDGMRTVIVIANKSFQPHSKNVFQDLLIFWHCTCYTTVISALPFSLSVISFGFFTGVWWGHSSLSQWVLCW